MRRPRIVVAGAGVAGALVARGLARLDAEVICLERAGPADRAEAGTGLNVGPNALKALRLHMPALAEAVRAAGFPWRRWRVGLTDGRGLFDLDLATVADEPGIRIRWAELYRVLRDGVAVRYGAEALALARQADGRVAVAVAVGGEAGAGTIPDVDLVVAADGRFSRLRAALVEASAPRRLGIAMYRLLLPRPPDCPIDDYAQWFNGANRLLAFAVPGGAIYAAGSFPIADAHAPVPEAMREPEALGRLYRPADGPPSRAAAFLIEGITARVPELHWSRAGEEAIAFAAGGWPVLLLGDAAHPMVPTLGQGATQAVEDALVAVDELALALARGTPLDEVPARVAARRAERVRFVMDLSVAASDTMLAGADPVAGALAKTEPAFLAQLAQLYRDVAGPRYRA